MNTHRLDHLDDATLRRDLHHHVSNEKCVLAVVIAHIAEFDSRRLYVGEAFPSMFAYCVGSLGYSEGAAYKRIRAARAARRFPRLFGDIAEGRLHLTAVCLLAPHLTKENLEELVGAATRRSKAEVEIWLASRFTSSEPVPSLRPSVNVIRPKVESEPGVGKRLSPGTVDFPLPDSSPVDRPAPRETIPASPSWPASAPTMQFILRIPIAEATHAKLRRIQDLLGHAVPSGNLTEVFDRALDALLVRLESRKHAATTRPRPRVATTEEPRKRSRSIPAHVRRAVWERDGGQCTFVSQTGHRCEARRGLEYDHVVPFARGGEATVEGLRLRCEAHNQYEAEQAFGVDFMRGKREAARR